MDSIFSQRKSHPQLPPMIETEDDIQILFQNSEYLAVAKSPGVSVHNNEDGQCLLGLLEKQLGAQGTRVKLFPAHRLDKETSGVQIFAFNSESAAKVAGEFQKQRVRKIYTGVLRGQLRLQEGEWNRPLTDKGEGRKNPEGSARDRVPCLTKFRVLESSSYFSLCEFDLMTGRQHQIRKHAALCNHPIVGDPRYGEPKYNAKIAELYKSTRMYLHCSRLELLGQVIECQIPSSFMALRLN
ncbi:MAG: RNA pseudouridine synthase [Bdellovibrionales bacterium]|jgi:23S rRNA-/tRNA-specific pseudouridylate synthase|nr:RNA pseudouridine synthase [Bdellovibrionales bacterium]